MINGHIPRSSITNNVEACVSELPNLKLDKTTIEEDTEKIQYHNTMDGTVVRFKNARIVRDGKLEHDELWVQDGKIVDPQKYFFDVKRRADEEIDCKNAIIAPGLIDIQFNGKY